MKKVNELLNNPKFLNSFYEIIKSNLSKEVQSNFSKNTLKSMCEETLKKLSAEFPSPKIWTFSDFSFRFSIILTCELGWSYEQFMAEDDYFEALMNMK